MAFVLDEFVNRFESADLDGRFPLLKSLKKSPLLAVASHYDCQVSSTTTKAGVLRSLVEHLIEEELLPEESDASEKPGVHHAIELKRLELELKLKEMEFAKEREEREAAKEREEREREREYREREKARELDERRAARESEERVKMRELELKQKEIDVQSDRNSNAEDRARPVNGYHLKLPPPIFREEDVEGYFDAFEKMATQMDWPRDKWSVILQSVLKGKAQSVYAAMTLEDSIDYESVKTKILDAYEKVPEAYRQQFRGHVKSDQQTFSEFASEKVQLFDRWVRSCRCEREYNRLREVLLVEEFVRKLAPELRTYISERKVGTLKEAATLADEYALVHRSRFPPKPRPNPPPPQSFRSEVRGQSGHRPNLSPRPVRRPFSVPPSRPSTHPSTRFPQPRLTCAHCHRPGHVQSECWRLHGRPAGSGPRPVAATGLPISGVAFEDFDPVPNEVSKDFRPFVSDSSVSLCNDPGSQSTIRVLRDTGAAQSLILKEVLPFSDESYSGSIVLIRGVGGVQSIPLHTVVLNSKMVSGTVLVGVCDTLPVDGISMLLGNDLAGARVSSEPCMSNVPVVSAQEAELQKEFSYVFPECVVTRAAAKKAHEQQVENVEVGPCLEGTFMTELEEDRVAKVPVEVVSQSASDVLPTLTREQLIQEQQNNVEIAALIDRALSEEEAAKVPVGYYLSAGLLMRKWRPPEVAANEDWHVRNQVVLPPSCRPDVLKLAHEAPTAGHRGVNKTCDRILRHFFWPGLRSSVCEFVKSCDTCQTVGKPNQSIPRAPLKPIPAFQEPFSHVLIDCVGPLPKTRAGNQYLLTIMCMSTRFPEAIPLRDISAKKIIQALVKFFTLVGLPQTLQSDQGSNFMSHVFQQVMYELGIEQRKSSAYHPQSQGAIERFHQSMKFMLKTYCHENDRDWDEGLPLVLFAARETMADSLGFSPFELVFGHTVRGPLKCLKEKLLSPQESTSLLEYVSSFRDRLYLAREHAKAHLESSQEQMKVWYDRRSRKRSFQPGDQVLLLSPLPRQPLQARFQGPYVVERRIGEVDYVLLTPDRRKHRRLCHINLLKAYHTRAQPAKDQPAVAAVSVSDPPPRDDFLEDFPSFKLRNSEILQDLDSQLSHLSPSQLGELKALILAYPQLFSDVPSRTNLVQHEVDVGDAIPIKQHPYRVHPEKQKKMSAEVDYLLEHDLIEPSSSSWSSPCLLVPKSDGSVRFCTDFRKVNHLTKPDSFPMPRIDDCIDRIGQAQYVTRLDLLKGFYQIDLTPDAREISAFVTPDGLFQYKVMPFGMRNGPATFQRLMTQVISGLKKTDVYIDDLVISGATWPEHLEHLSSLFDRLADANLTVNLDKCEFAQATVTFLGHVVGQGQILPLKAKVEAIEKFPPPDGKKALMRFLGMAGFYRKFCRNFSPVVAPLTDLLRKGAKFKWSDTCQAAFDKVKAMLSHSPVLAAPDFSKPFCIAVDSCDIGTGSVLTQQDDAGIDHPVCFFSKKFNTHQRNYSTIEKEALGLILALQHFEAYVDSSSVPVVVYTDHNPLTFVHKMRTKNQRLLRWSLALQAYNINIKHIKGTHNVVADALSRQPIG